MVYPGIFYGDDGQILLVMQRASGNGGLIMMHSENGIAIDFATMLTPAPDSAAALTGWIARVRAENLPFLHPYTTRLERDRAAVDATLTFPWHNGRTEGVNNKIKLIKRQTSGRAGHPLLRQRLLLS